MTTHAPTPPPPLRQSEAELQALFSAISDVILVLDADGRYVKIAPTSPSLLYRPAPELIGRTLHEVFDQENADKFLGYIRRALAARETVQAEYSLQIEGREVWFAAAISPMDDRQVVLVARDISDRQRAEQIQLATYRISEAAHAAGNLQDLFAAIHEIVGGLMPAKNFYIALYDPVADLVSFPYFVDEYDTEFPSKRLGKGLTEYVLRTGQALLATPELHQELEQRGEVELIGAPSIDWLGVPLKAGDRTIGVLVAQTYTPGVRYGEREKHILQFVSTQVAMAIERKRAEEGLLENERRYRLLFQANPEAMWVYDDETLRFLAVNAAAVQRYGYSEHEFLAMTVRDIRPASESVRFGETPPNDTAGTAAGSRDCPKAD